MVVERFVAWLEKAGTEDKCQAIADIIKTFNESDPSSQEHAACERLFGFFLADPQTSVRRELAAQIAQCKGIPQSLVWNLLQDDPCVAAPLYATSRNLCERTLIAGIEDGGTIVQIAIAGRSGLSASVVRAIIAKGSTEAIVRLLANEEIVLGPVLKHDIAMAHGDNAAIREALFSETDLAPATRQMLVRGLSNALVSFAKHKNWSDDKRLKIIANDAANRASVDIASNAKTDQMESYVAHLRASKQLTPALILRAICSGRGAFFETALASLSDMSMKRVQSIIDDGRPSAFRALYRRTNLPEKAFNVFCTAIAVWQHLEGEFAYSSMTEAELYEKALREIVQSAQEDTTTDASLMAMLHRMLNEATRDQLHAEHNLKLLAAA